MTDQSVKLWSASLGHTRCVGVEFQVHKDVDLAAFELDLDFGSIKCYAVFSEYISTEYSFEMVTSHWTRSDNVYLPQDLFEMISSFANYFPGYANPKRNMRLHPDYTQKRKTLFSSKQSPLIRLRARGTYKL